MFLYSFLEVTPVGGEAPIFRNRFTRISAYGLVTEGNNILLCRLATKDNNHSKWTLPGGGLVFGEHPEDAVVREIEEETGLIVDPMNLITVQSELISFPNRDMHAIRFIYRVKVLRGELRNELGGSTDLCQWFDRAAAEKLALVDLARDGVWMAFGD